MNQALVQAPNPGPPAVRRSWKLSGLSLNTKICASATALVILSLAATATVIGIRSSGASEAASMALARTAAREAGAAVKGRIVANLGAVVNLAGSMRATQEAGLAPSRAQIGEMTKATLSGSTDLLGASVVYEPNALDGKDAEYAGRKPEFDASGRYMPYYSRSGDGAVHIEPIVFSGAPGADDWYDVPKRSGRVVFTEPYAYPVNGKDVLMASLVAPIVVKGAFVGTASADLQLTTLGTILAALKPIEGGQLALVSNGGLYASHPDAARNGKKAENIPAAGLDAVRTGQPYEYVDAAGTVHLLQPLRLHPDIAPWAVELSFPQRVATAPARELLGYMLAVALVCALVAAIAQVTVLARLMRPLRQLAAAMTGLAGGSADLTARLDARGSDELAVIAGGFNTFVGRIQQVLARVRHSSDSVATASAEILQGNSDLSARTEQQAGALEETAASMEELTSTVRQNADNARQANELAGAASQIAARGGSVVTEVVRTMESISASSNKVVDIIAVIDGIAFQTNILALNAAVEAARAGEQGRGFAVVAAEVRSLAQRSAAAAKEIKELIGDSVEKVGAGRTLVLDAGKTMEDVVESVRRVSGIVAEISAASVEQSSGIAQVNQAIGQMDGATQQNAALVEEAAAAADSLRQQAEVLVALVSEFRIDEEPHAGKARLPGARRALA
jgi:methyl-accepting chemotaxis protein